MLFRGHSARRPRTVGPSGSTEEEPSQIDAWRVSPSSPSHISSNSRAHRTQIEQRALPDSVLSVARVATAPAAAASAVSSQLNTASVFPPPPPPSSARRPHRPAAAAVASPFAATQAQRRAQHEARRLSAAQQVLFVHAPPAAAAAARARTATARTRSSEQPSQQQQQQQLLLLQSAQQPRGPPAPRLTTPHLPVFLTSPEELERIQAAENNASAAADAAASADANSSNGGALQLYAASTATAAAAATSVPAAVPASSTSLTPSRLAVPNAHVIFQNFQRWFASQREQRRAHDQASSTAAAAWGGGGLSASLPPPFHPTFYSYPRLYYSPSTSTGGVGVGGPLKLQAHLVEVRSEVEMRGALGAFRTQMDTTAAPANSSSSSNGDAPVRNCAFAFRIATQQHGALQPDDNNEEHKEEEDRSSSRVRVVVVHGCDDGGSDRGSGSGSKLLSLLEVHRLTNLLLLVTESGGAAATSATATHRHSAFKHACLVKTARIMLQDYVRLQLSSSSSSNKPTSARTTGGEAEENGWLEQKEETVAETRIVPAAAAATVVPPILALRQQPPPPPSSPRGGVVSPRSPRLPLRRTPLPSHLVPLPKFSPSVSSTAIAAAAAATAPSSGAPSLVALTPEDEEVLSVEIGQLLRGQAFARLSVAAIHPAHRPAFPKLWDAFATLCNDEEEAQSDARFSRSNPNNDAPTSTRALDGELDRPPNNNPDGTSSSSRAPHRVAPPPGFATLVLSRESTAASSGREGQGGRMAGTMQPDPRAALRIQNKILALAASAGGTGFDSQGRGSFSDRSFSSPSSSAWRRSGGRVDPLAHLGTSRGGGARSNIDQGDEAQFAIEIMNDLQQFLPWSPSSTSSFSPTASTSESGTSLPPYSSRSAFASVTPPSQGIRGGVQQQQQQQQWAQELQDRLLSELVLESELSEAEWAGLLSPSQWGLAHRRRPLLRLLGTPTLHETHPSHLVVPSWQSLYAKCVHGVFQQQSLELTTRLSRRALRLMADTYLGDAPAQQQQQQGSDPSSKSALASASVASPPPFLLRLLMLCVGLLLRWRSLHWSTCRLYLRGEVLCPVPVIAAAGAAAGTKMKEYLARQELEAGPLPPPIPPERLADTVMQREDMEQRVEQFQQLFRRSQRTGTSGGVVAEEGEELEDAPRDLLFHLQSLDVSRLPSGVVGQVRTLLRSEGSTLTTRGQDLATLAAPTGAQAALILEWVRLALRTHRTWIACKSAFVERQHPPPQPTTPRLLRASEETTKRINADVQQHQQLQLQSPPPQLLLTDSQQQVQSGSNHPSRPHSATPPAAAAPTFAVPSPKRRPIRIVG